MGSSSRPNWLPTHLRGLRRSWLFLIVVAITLLALVEGGRTLAKVHRAIVPGVYYNLRLHVIAPIAPEARAAGIEPGDRILAIDGRRIDDPYALADAMTELGAERAVRVEVATGEQAPREVTLTTAAASWPTAWLRFLVGVTFVLVGVGVFWFHPGRRESWPFLFACVARGVTALAAVGEPRTTESWLDTRVGLFAVALIGPMFLHLFAVFPRPLRIVVRRPSVLVVLDTVAVAIGVGTAAMLAIERPLAVMRFITTSVNALSVVASVAILVWRLRRPAPREDTTRLRALIVAVLLAFPIPAALGLADRLGYAPSSFAPTWLAAALGVSFPLIVGFAILRRDLFEIDRAVARAAATSSIIGAVAVVMVATAFALPQLVAPDSVVGSPSAMTIVVLGGIALLWPIKRRIQERLIDRFGRPDVDERVAVAREALNELAEAAEPALFGKFERRLEEAVDAADAALLLPQDTAWRRPATGERLERDGLAHFVEVRLQHEVVAALAFGRPGSRFVLPPSAQKIVDGLVPEIASALRTQAPGDKIADYRIERLLGAGGMGNVYVAAKAGAGGFVKRVAIKQLLPELAVEPAAVERFLKEARLVARLSHPGIVQTFELGETNQGYFIVMEYVEGVDASTLMRRLKRRRERVPLAVAAHIVTSASLALSHAHRACDESGAPLNLIHHDVSPHNLMIDGDGNVKLADFGVAHVRHDASLEGQLIGKVGYISPEQIAGEPYDQRIDVFAAGVVLYELVTGQHPFARASEEATLRATEHGRFLPPETLRDDCSDALARVIARAMARVDHRYATAAELAEALQGVYPLDSRHAGELGRLVGSVQTSDAGASVRMPAATKSLPTVRG